MSVIDTFGEYVRARLDAWGREFALQRDCEYLGHQSKNMLQVLIEHKGGVTARQVNRKADRNPYTGKSSLRHLHGAWLSGWQAQDLISRGK